MSYVLCGVIVCVLVWFLFRRREEDPLEHLPGPKKYPLIGHVLYLMKIKPDKMLYVLMELAQKYGDRFILKIPGKMMLHIYNPVDVELVLSSSRNITKSKPYKFLQSWLGTGLLLSTGTKWHTRRKILTAAFHFNILKSFFVIIEEKSLALVELLKTSNGAEVDIVPVMSDFTLSTICDTAMGTQLDTDKSAATLGYKNAIIKIGYLIISRVTKVWLYNDVIYRNTEGGRQFGECLKTVVSFADNVIQKRKEQRMLNNKEGLGVGFKGETIERIDKKRLAMLDLLLEAEDKGEIDLEGIREEVNTFMFEGHDTTAVGLTFCLMLLADHEDIQERIYAETQQVLAKCGGVLTMSDFSEMKYLEAVIKESLRLYPSVPFIGRDVEEDFMLGDLLVKKGTEVLIHIYHLHRREDLYPDPESFRPERFLAGEPKHPYEFVPFSAGLRNCIGQRFAMLEMKSAISEICRHFRLEPRARGHRPVLMWDMVLRPVEPVYIKFIPRA